MPIIVSSFVILYSRRSIHACSLSSSANSTAFLIAASPPAIIPTIIPCSIPNVGGHSLASTIPILPLVPAPI